MKLEPNDKNAIGRELEVHCHPDGSCTRCGECCSTTTLNMSDKDRKALHDYVQKHQIKRESHIPVDMPKGKAEDAFLYDMICPFLKCEVSTDNRSKTSECTVYDARPYICRIYTCKYNKNPDDRPMPNDIDKDILQAFQKEPVNLQHEFFPETLPKKNDMVAFNIAIPKLHDAFLNQTFLVTATDGKYADLYRPDIKLQKVPVYALIKGEKRKV